MVRLIFVFVLITNFCYAQDTIKEIEIVNAIQSWPQFNGRIDEFVKQSISYPEKAITDSIKGVVYVTFWVDTLGFTYDHKVANGIKELNEEALRIAKTINFNKPAYQNGDPVKVLYTLPIRFELSNVGKKKQRKDCR
ncbi:MAG: energy transducer TonB [Bacteroidales bacterium]|nr:energy transducer TonB [Bacteroidales bacterium]